MTQDDGRGKKTKCEIKQEEVIKRIKEKKKNKMKRKTKKVRR